MKNLLVKIIFTVFALHLFNLAYSQNPVSLFPYAEGFENNTKDWTGKSPDKKEKWEKINSAQSPVDSVLILPAEGSCFYHLETTKALTVTLEGPVFELPASASVQFSFFYRNAGNPDQLFGIEASEPGNEWFVLWKQPGNPEPVWTQEMIDLSGFNGKNVSLRFFATSNDTLPHAVSVDGLNLSVFTSKMGNEGSAVVAADTSATKEEAFFSPVSSRGYSFSSTESEPSSKESDISVMQLKSTAIAPDTGVNVLNSGNYDIYQYTVDGETTEILNTRRNQDSYSIFQVNAPENSPYESTLALMNELGSTGAEFMDLYNQSYSGENQFGIRLQKRGSGNFKPFVIDFTDGTTKTKVFQTAANQYSTFFGGLGLEGEFLSVNGSGDGYSYAGLELRSYQGGTSKVWQIVHKQDIPNALAFAYHNGTSWNFPFMISGAGNAVFGSLTDNGADRLQVNGTSSFSGGVRINNANLTLRGDGSKYVRFERADGTLQGYIRNSSSSQYFAIKNNISGGGLYLYDSGKLEVFGPSYFDSNLQINSTRLTLKSDDSKSIRFEKADGTVQGSIKNSSGSGYFSIENDISDADIRLYDSGEIQVNGDKDIAIKSYGLNRNIRFTEGTLVGAFIGYDGQANNLLIGTHPTDDADPANDLTSLQIARSSGNVTARQDWTFENTLNALNGYRLNGQALNINHLSSEGALIDQVPVADGNGGISWQNVSGAGGGASQWTDNPGYISYTAGDVQIGTNATPRNLYASGKIYTTEVLVQATVPVPDYVFEKEYQLTNLDELANYLDENKHLPGIPSASEIEKDGINLAEMNLLLLKKVEELTLYILQQEKRIRELEEKDETGKSK